MPTSSTLARRARQLPYWPFVLLLMLGAGCRSTQSSYQFRPPATATALPPTPTQPNAASTTAASATGTQHVSAKQDAAVRPRSRQVTRQQVKRLIAHVPTATLAKLRAQAGEHQNTQATQRVARPQHKTEVGLGTTVLGVLGLVVLPISLLGLLIWGGPVWAILAGLAAIAILVAYLDPFA